MPWLEKPDGSFRQKFTWLTNKYLQMEASTTPVFTVPLWQAWVMFKVPLIQWRQRERESCFHQFSVVGETPTSSQEGNELFPNLVRNIRLEDWWMGYAARDGLHVYMRWLTKPNANKFVLWQIKGLQGMDRVAVNHKTIVNKFYKFTNQTCFNIVLTNSSSSLRTNSKIVY